MRQKVILTSLSPQLFLYQEKPPFYLGELYYETMTESILNLGTTSWMMDMMNYALVFALSPL